MANFIGVEGLRLRRPRKTQSHARTGAKVITIAGLTAWYQVAGNAASRSPHNVRSVFCAANTFIELPACSKAVQKRDVADEGEHDDHADSLPLDPRQPHAAPGHPPPLLGASGGSPMPSR